MGNTLKRDTIARINLKVNEQLDELNEATQLRDEARVRTTEQKLKDLQGALLALGYYSIKRERAKTN